jgi:hypothetical protein
MSTLILIKSLQDNPTQLSLQKRITKRTTNNRNTGADRVTSTLGIQTGVYLDKIQRDELPSFGNALGDEVTLTQSQPTAYWSTGARCPHGIQSVDVEGEMNGRIASDPTQCHIHDFANAMPIVTR